MNNKSSKIKFLSLVFSFITSIFVILGLNSSNISSFNKSLNYDGRKTIKNKNMQSSSLGIATKGVKKMI